MTRHAITIRVDYDTLTQLHKLTANAKTTAFADVAGDLLDKAAAPNTYLVVVPPKIAEHYRRVAWDSGETMESLMLVVLATATARPVHTNSARQYSEEAINLEQR